MSFEMLSTRPLITILHPSQNKTLLPFAAASSVKLSNKLWPSSQKVCPSIVAVVSGMLGTSSLWKPRAKRLLTFSLKIQFDPRVRTITENTVCLVPDFRNIPLANALQAGCRENSEAFEGSCRLSRRQSATHRGAGQLQVTF